MMTGTMLANAGTALMLAGAAHLILGNLLIGIAEGLLLGFLFKLPKWKTIAILILANYFSAWIGFGLLVACQRYFNEITVYQVASYLWTALAVAYLVTLLLEWPFIWLAMKSKAKRLMTSIWAVLIIQTLSYAILAGFWYYPVSGISLVQNTVLVPTTDFTRNKNAVVYFIHAADGDVYKMNLEGSSLTKVYTLDLDGKWVEMSLEKNPQNNTLDLVCYSESQDRWQDKTVICPSLIPENEVSMYFQSDPEWQSYPYEPVDLRQALNRQWMADTGFWPTEGLALVNKSTEEKIHLAMETPFLAWFTRQVTILPGDEVVFEVGKQICLFDRHSRKLAMLAKGSSPVVVLGDIIKITDKQQ